MQVARASSGTDSPSPATFKLPPAMVEKAADRLCWITMLCAITTVVSFSLQHYMQPEMKAMIEVNTGSAPGTFTSPWESTCVV